MAGTGSSIIINKYQHSILYVLFSTLPLITCRFYVPLITKHESRPMSPTVNHRNIQNGWGKKEYTPDSEQHIHCNSHYKMNYSSNMPTPTDYLLHFLSTYCPSPLLHGDLSWISQCPNWFNIWESHITRRD